MWTLQRSGGVCGCHTFRVFLCVDNVLDAPTVRDVTCMELLENTVSSGVAEQPLVDSLDFVPSGAKVVHNSAVERGGKGGRDK